MNYYSTDIDLRQSVASLLKLSPETVKRVNISISYSQNRKKSIVTIEVSPSSTIQALFFVYTRSLTLFDVFSYRSKSVYRISRNARTVQHIDRINRLLLTRVANASLIAPKNITEDDDEQEKLKQKDLQMQQLKDKNRLDRERARIEKNVTKSLRTQLQALKSRKKMA